MNLLFAFAQLKQEEPVYTLIKNSEVRKRLAAEVPALAVSAMTAELVYKFHSFTAECLGFLATWFAVSYVFSLARTLWPSKTRSKRLSPESGY